ncbi:uncharacterized protein RCH25_025904 [Pelodytes ibericus]
MDTAAGVTQASDGNPCFVCVLILWVTFDDAAVYFSEEQWQNLEEVQKKVYKELIKEIYETMLYLGYRIPKPEIVSQIERGEEPCTNSCKKPKLPEAQPKGLPVGSKDSEPVVKAEPLSPITCNPPRPAEISSSQEKHNRAQCQACGMHCNNQCGMTHNWNQQRMYLGPPMDAGPGKQYVGPPPPYFNGSASSPCFVNRGDGLTHPTSPVTSYGNVVMNPLSPTYTGYRPVQANPTSPFAMNDRMGNPMYGNYEASPQAPLVPAGHNAGNPEQENRRREQYMRESAQAMIAQNASFQDRRNSAVPCPGCGMFCNNQCGMSFQWDPKRTHHVAPHVADGNRYPAPSNLYFNANPPQHFPNGNPGMRHGTPPGNAQGNMGMIQLSSPYTYRRPGDPKSPNMLPPRSENSPGSVSMPVCTMGTAAPTYVQSQGNKYGAFPNNGNQRRSQAMSPLASIETMPMFGGNKSPGAVNEQRMRHPSPAVTSSDGNKGAVHQNTINWRFSGQGNSAMARNPLPAGQSQTNNGKPTHQRPGEATNSRSPSTTVNPSNAHFVKNVKPLPSPVSSQESSRMEGPVSHRDVAVKRVGPPIDSDSSRPSKMASPPIIIIDCEEVKTTSPLYNAGNGQVNARSTPPTTKSGNLVTPAMPSGDQDSKNNTLPENKDGKPMRRSIPQITIKSIRSAGVFMPPMSKSKNKAVSSSSGPIVIIDEENKDGDPHSTAANTPNNEIKGSTGGNPSVNNIKANGDPTAGSPQGNAQTHNVTQNSPFLVHKLPSQNPSNIIVTGNPGLGNSSVPVPINGNQSIMLTFPVTVGNSGIVLTTGIKPTARLPISRNPRHPSTLPMNARPGNGNAKFVPMAVTSLIGQANVPPGQAKPITVGVGQQPANIARNLNVNNPNAEKVNSGALKAVPGTGGRNPAVGQTIPLFVDANSGIILTAPTVTSKESSGMGNATVVTVNGNMVTGNVALGGKLFGNLAPVNVNGGLGIRNTTFFTMDGALGIGNGTPVTITNNSGGKGTLSINNPQILTVNSGGGLGVTGTNTNLVNTSKNLQVAHTAASDQTSAGMIIRKINDPCAPPKIQHPITSAERTNHAINTLFKCSQCEERFSTLESVAAHQKSHEEAKSTSENRGEDAAKDPSDASMEGDGDSPTILYTTQGDDGSTVYVVTV